MRYTKLMKLPIPLHIRKGGTLHGIALIAAIATAGMSLTYGAPIISSLFAAATSSLGGAEAVAYFSPYSESPALTLGETAKFDININASSPMNVLGATLAFPDSLEVVSISKERSFMDLWTEETTINEETGRLQFSGGTTKKGGLTGVATAITISVRAKKIGQAQLTFSEAFMYASDGKGRELKTNTRPYTLTIVEPVRVGSGASATSPSATQGAAPPGPLPPSGDVDGNGKVTLVDATIIVLRFIAPYDTRYDLDRNGRVDWGDVNIVFSQMGK